MQIVELEMVPLSLRPVLQRLYDMKTTQSALREGVLFSTKRNNYYYDTGTGKVIVLDDDIEEIDTAGLRKRISAIFQDFIKYPFTAEKNIKAVLAERYSGFFQVPCATV